ncbi:MAG: 6-bladed beta-propeller [Gemmatimonadota bacterium]|nr:6-bladed beta-propeller [Gemmatimonadota bacterium]
MLLTPVLEHPLHSQAPTDSVIPRQIRETKIPHPILDLSEAVRIGSENGEYDAFGRVTDAVFLESGAIAIADAILAQVVVFSQDARWVRSIGRSGDGPGEFRLPAVLAAGADDSLLVWDARTRTISFFDAQGKYVRSFRTPPQWIVSSMRSLPGGQLLVSAFDPQSGRVLHIVDMTGAVLRSFGPRPSRPLLEPFQATLLGGYIDVMGGKVAYTNKSPYEIWLFEETNAKVFCAGRPNWTSDPRTVVSRSTEVAHLDWNSYIHSARILFLSDSLLLNVLFDPVAERRTVDLVTIDCRLLRRQEVHSPVMFTDRWKGRLLAVRNLDYPEVVLYDYTVGSARRGEQ